MKNHNYLICLVFVIFLALFSATSFADSPGAVRVLPTSFPNGSTITVNLFITASGSYSLDDSAPEGWNITSSSSDCQFLLNRIRCANYSLTGLATRLISYNVVVNNTNGLYGFSGTYSVDGTAGTITTGTGTPATNNAPVSPTLIGPSSGVKNTNQSYTATATDPESNQIKYEWDWNGDNVVDETSLLVNSGAQDQRNHNFTATGTYTVKVRATDSSDAVGPFSQVTTIITEPATQNTAPAQPTIAGPSSGYKNYNQSFTATATDPESNQIKYEWDWNGDNMVDETSLLVNSGAQDQRNHNFTATGTYTAKVRSVDSLGLSSAFASQSITIADQAALSVSIGGPYTTVIDQPVSFTSQVSGGTGGYSYSWNFGDGQTSNQQNPSHTYSSVGAYTAQLVVADSTANTVTKTATVTINSASALPGNVRRVVPSSVAAGTTVAIALDIDIGNGTALVLEEYPPSGWQLVSVENKLGCSLSPAQNPTSIACIVLNNPTSSIVYYNVSVPSSASIGTSHTFTGTYGIKKNTQENTVIRTIGGNVSTAIGSVADFSISIGAASSEVTKGLSNNFQVTTTSMNGYNNQISFSTLSLPTGVTVSFNPQSGIQTFISTVTISASSSATAGTYPITIRATGADGKTKDVIHTITIKEPVVTTPLTASAGGPYNSTVNTPLQFASTANGGVAPYTYNWSFGNGAASAQQNPLYIYNTTGNYTVTINVRDFSGLSIINATTVYVVQQVVGNITLIVDTSPVKGNITVDGVYRGVAPVTLSLSQGSHNIFYSSISGYTTPSNETVNLIQNQTINRTYSLIQVAVCGDGSCNNGETTSSCPKDCGSAQCISNVDFKDSEKLEMSATCLSSGIISSWNVNDPAVFPVTAFSLTPKTSLGQSTITARKIVYSSAGLSIPYQFFNITSSINDSSINSATLSFVVRNTWISSNKINNATVSLYKYGSAWEKIAATKVKEDATYTYYQASISGFGLYAVDGQKADCPTCNPPTTWSPCTNSVQTRTNYICNDPAIGCVPAQESSSCCPTCPANIDSSCANGVITKKAYRCGPDTNFVCSESVTTTSCISSQDAQTAINNAISAIDIADKDSKNTTSAKDILIRSQAAFAIGDYQNARQLAADAEAATKSAPILAKPFFLPIPFEMLIIIITAAAGAGAGVLIWKKKSGASLCTVCAKPTAMKFLCSTCNGHVCFKDSKIYQGKVYCANCMRRLGMASQQPPRQL